MVVRCFDGGLRVVRAGEDGLRASAWRITDFGFRVRSVPGLSGDAGGDCGTISGRDSCSQSSRYRVGTHGAGTGALASGVAGQAVLFGAVGAAGLSQRGPVGAVSTEALFLPVLAALGCRLSVAFLSFVGSERGLLGPFPIRWLGGFILSCRGLGFGGAFLALVGFGLDCGLVGFGLDCGLVGIMPVERHMKVEFILEGVPPCPLVRGSHEEVGHGTDGSVQSVRRDRRCVLCSVPHSSR